jgi:ABC-2 type transport system ATP-binding protein
MVQLTKWKNSQVGTFSTGMRQRMNVIRALLNAPQVLYLDEPTLGLDPQSSVEIREFVKKLNRDNGTTVVLTTHMMVDADLMCDRIAIVDHGKVVALDTPANLKKTVSETETTIIKLTIPNLSSTLIEKLQALKCADAITQESATELKFLVHGDDALDSIIDAIRANGGKISSMENLQPTLEDVFLHITGHQVRDTVDQKIPLGHRGFQQGRIR